MLYGCPSLPAGARTLALELETSWDLPSLASGATANVDVAVPSVRRGDFADASLDTSSIAFVLDCHVWSNDKVRVTARNVSASRVDLAAAPKQPPYAGHIRRGGGARDGRSSRRAPSHRYSRRMFAIRISSPKCRISAEMIAWSSSGELGSAVSPPPRSRSMSSGTWSA